MELRLFPLHTVLFPTMALPLHVFEPRYLQLVEDCTAAGEPFGVALIREGPEVGGFADPFEIGTTARIEEAEQNAAGTLRLLARGEQRFRVLELHHDRPYLRADVEVILDRSIEFDPVLAEQARALLTELERLRGSVRGEYVRTPDAARDVPAELLADTIGATGAGSAADRQRLLSTLDPVERLERAVAILDVSLEALRRRATEAATQRWSGLGGLN